MDSCTIKKERILVAVSAGPDSMALLHYLNKENIVVACYINHKQRIKENINEIKIVKNFCWGNNIPFYLREISLKIYTSRKNGNMQNFFREQRYEILYNLACSININKIATGHHYDDQVETIFMRFIKNFNIEKDFSIKNNLRFRDIYILRPFIRKTKKDILDYCKKNNIPYSIDSSNLNNVYLRNKIRNIIFPIIKKENLKFEENFLKFITNSNFLYNYFKSHVKKQLENIKCIEFVVFKKFITDKEYYFKLTATKILLEDYLNIKQYKSNFIDLVLYNITHKSSIKVNIKKDVYLYTISGKFMVMDYKTLKVPPANRLLLKMGNNVFDKFRIVCEKINNIDTLIGEDYKFLLIEKSVFFKGIFITYPDKSYKIAIKDGAKKINRLYIDNKISVYERYKYPIITADNTNIIYDYLTDSVSYHYLFNKHKTFIKIKFYIIIS